MSEVKEFLLKKLSKPVISRDYDAILAHPESECDPADIKAEKILGYIRCVPKKSYDAVVKEREKWKAHYDVKQGVCEELIKEIGEKNVEIELLRTTKSAMSDVLDYKDQEIQRLRWRLGDVKIKIRGNWPTEHIIDFIDKALNPDSKGGG